jgi:hypothetical protein
MNKKHCKLEIGNLKYGKPNNQAESSSDAISGVFNLQLRLNNQ